jgi:hypothetical protein
MTVEIDFPTDDVAVSDLEGVLGLDSVVMRFELLVDDEPVLAELSGGEYYGDWFYMFLKVCLETLPHLHDGDCSQFEFEGSVELKFDSDGERVTTYLSDNNGCVSGERYEMNLEEFAREVIHTSEDFLEFALDVRPDERGRWTAKQFRETLEEAKFWYRETYGEDV